MQTKNKEIRLSYRNIYILPTQRGLGFVALITLLLLIAFIYNNNLVYLLSFLLASIFFITILHTVKSLEGLVISKGKSPNVFMGDTAEGLLLIDNSAKQKRYSVELGFDKKNSHPVDLEADTKTLVTLSEKANQRGWFQMTQPVISSGFPFGLFRAWTRLNIKIKVLVYPRPSQQIVALPEDNSSHLEQQGNAQKGQDDFYGLQNYQAGDNIRQIHWRAFAKGQGLYIKQYSGAQNAEICLDYEQTLGADKEQRLSQMCRWVIEADKAGIAYSFKLAGLQIESTQGEAHSKKCLAALALF